MNKPIFALSVLSAFLAGVLAGPWLRPQPPAPPPVVQTPPPAPPRLLPPPPPIAPPPAATSELQLKGVFAGADASRSRALIAYGDSSPKLYRLDEKLPDGSVLKAVGGKSIEVEKNGQTRSVPLTRGSSSAGEPEAPSEELPSAPASDAAPAPAAAGASAPEAPGPASTPAPSAGDAEPAPP